MRSLPLHVNRVRGWMLLAGRLSLSLALSPSVSVSVSLFVCVKGRRGEE